MQVGIRVFEAAVKISCSNDRLFSIDGVPGQPTGNLGEAAAKEPIHPGAQPQEQGMKTASLFHRGIKPNLLDPGWVVLDQMIAAQTEFSDQPVIMIFKILDSAPGEVAGLLAGEAGEVTLLDQCDFGTLAGKRCRRHRAVYPATDDQNIVNALVQFLDVAVTKFHRWSFCKAQRTYAAKPSGLAGSMMTADGQEAQAPTPVSAQDVGDDERSLRLPGDYPSEPIRVRTELKTQAEKNDSRNYRGEEG